MLTEIFIIVGVTAVIAAPVSAHINNARRVPRSDYGGDT
jgi:hypothetical protein